MSASIVPCTHAGRVLALLQHVNPRASDINNCSDALRIHIYQHLWHSEWACNRRLWWAVVRAFAESWQARATTPTKRKMHSLDNEYEIWLATILSLAAAVVFSIITTKVHRRIGINKIKNKLPDIHENMKFFVVTFVKQLPSLLKQQGKKNPPLTVGWILTAPSRIFVLDVNYVLFCRFCVVDQLWQIFS